MKTANQLFEEKQEVHRKMQALLRADGRMPHSNSPKRAKWDRLAEQSERLLYEWAEADTRERKQKAVA